MALLSDVPYKAWKCKDNDCISLDNEIIQKAENNEKKIQHEWTRKHCHRDEKE